MRLSSELGAHATLKSIYADSSQPVTVRVRAAQAALGHESAPLKPVEPAIDATCEEVVPLAELVERQRARMDRLLALPLKERAALFQGVGRDGNGQDDGDST
jgi:hypothetical protein